ncbi:MAG: adenosine deaminase [Saprospiraceae bacterium]|nr:adenosine deaminase [Saprospiraceae bacterium]
MNFKKLPKIELHLHLDCSLSFPVVNTLDPKITLEQYHHSFIANDECHSLPDYLERAVRGVELMQDKRSLRLVTLDLFNQMKADGVLYAEIRFAPFLHLQAGLSPGEVVETVDLAVKEGMRNTGIGASVILCTLRHFSEDESMETVNLVGHYRKTTVSGFDIAADEAGFPVDNHIQAFKYAQQEKLHITAHAGEACGPESVWETLEHFKPARIGHGIRSTEDPRLLKHLKENKIHLEICPTSNIQTGVYETYAGHQADFIFRSGVSMSINTDGRTISNVTLSQEYKKMHDNFGWSKDHFLQCNLMAIDAAFISASSKKELKQRFLASWRSDE